MRLAIHELDAALEGGRRLGGVGRSPIASRALALTLVDGAGQGTDLARKTAESDLRGGMHNACTSYAQSMHQIRAGAGGRRRGARGTISAVDGRNERDARRLAKSIHG